MAIQVSCPHCKREFDVPAELAGQRIRCEACSGMVGVPMNAEIVDEPAPATASDDEPLVAEVVRPGPPRERGRRKKRSIVKVLLVLSLVAVSLACLVGAGGTGVWYFVLRDRGLAGDLKYMPDGSSHLHVVNYD